MALSGCAPKWESPPGKELNPGELSADDYPTAMGPNLRFSYTPLQSRIPRGQWRAVENSSNVFVTQSFMDELAHLAGRDPLEFRLALIDAGYHKLDPESRYDPSRMRAVLSLVAERAGWGLSFPQGRGRGIAACFESETYVAEVVEVSVDAEGAVKVDRVVCAVDCGLVVNLSGAEAQIQGAVIQGLSAALGEEIIVEQCRVVQGNFDTYPVLRIPSTPRIQVDFSLSRGESPGGLGEPGLPAVVPALGNAIFAATGQRIRRLPIRKVESRVD